MMIRSKETAIARPAQLGSSERDRARPLVLSLAREFARELRVDLGDNLLSLAVYGSFARGDFVLTSDLDLLVILRTADRICGHRVDLVLPAILRTRKSEPYRALRALGFMPDFAPLIYRGDELTSTPAVFIDAAHDAVIICDTGMLAEKFLQVRMRMKDLGSQRIKVGERDWYWILKPGSEPGEDIEI
jgi:predicted nucleotidyltransferase